MQQLDGFDGIMEFCRRRVSLSGREEDGNRRVHIKIVAPGRELAEQADAGVYGWCELRGVC